MQTRTWVKVDLIFSTIVMLSHSSQWQDMLDYFLGLFADKYLLIGKIIVLFCLSVLDKMIISAAQAK